MKVLLITLAIGEQYLKIYNLLFRQSHEEYAKRHGYDFKIITNFLSSKTNLPIQHPHLISFQKILVCSQPFSKTYDYIIFIDADVLINKNAPALHNIIDFGDKIGIVDEYSQPTKELRIQLQKNNKWEDNATDYYKLAGLDINTYKVLNTGVLVMQPAKHASFLLDIYNKYGKMAINHPRGFGYEQSCIGYELQKTNNYVLLDNKWNALWILYRDTNCFGRNLQEMYNQNYFIHFAGKCDYHLVNKIIM
jgi:hypothetical protein